MKTKREILQDVANLIKKQGGRSLNPIGGCVYEGVDGRLCGHSMAVKEEYRESCEGFAADDVIEAYTDEVHQEIYQGHSIIFWKEVQHFHDTEDFWTGSNDLSEEGRGYVELILNKYEQ